MVSYSGLVGDLDSWEHGVEESAQTSVARDYLDTLMAEYVMRVGVAVKTADVAREVGEPLGASARLVRSELTRSDRLLLVDRRWDLRTRHERRTRSADGALQHILRYVGKPLPLAQLAQELALMRGRTREDLQRVVETLVKSRDTYFLTTHGLVGLSEWLLDVAPDDDDEQVRRYNFFGVEVDLDAVLERFDLAAIAAAETTADGFVELISQVDEPVANRLALYVLWRARGEVFDSKAVLEAALQDERLVLLPGPSWATPTHLEAIRAVISDLSAQQEVTVEETEEVDIQEAIEAEPAELAEFALSPDDINEIQRVVQEAGEALPLPSIVSDVFELFPGDPQYKSALRVVTEGLRGDDRFVQLPDNRWHLRVLLPPTLYRVPVTLQLSPIVVTTLTGEPVDAMLTDAGLEGGLEWEVRAPDLEDIGEEGEVPDVGAGIQLATRQRYVTSYRHFVSGTIKVRKIDRGVFPTEPEIRPIRLIDRASGEAFELWLNNTTGLLCGLDEWYKGRLQPAGHVFFIERVADADVWYADIDDEPDASQLIPQPRLDELLVLRVRLEHAQDVSALEIMRNLMENHPGGVSFRRLYTECNIVRRIAKRVIASNLSSYPMFSLNDDETLWLYDEKKANRPRSPQKSAFIIGDSGSSD